MGDRVLLFVKRIGKRPAPKNKDGGLNHGLSPWISTYHRPTSKSHPKPHDSLGYGAECLVFGQRSLRHERGSSNRDAEDARQGCGNPR
jgi:hypothetical protein